MSRTAFLEAPRISVALCTYNGEDYLEQQLTSILSQTIPPFELIISDDHSTDGTLDLAERVCQKADIPVRILRNTHATLGVKGNFEKAILACSGDYIALSDQDDVWNEDKLEVFTQAILDSDSATPTLFYSDMDLIDSEGERLGETFFSKAKIRPPATECWKFLATRNFTPGCCTVFDRKLADIFLPLPEESIIHDWWITLIYSLCGNVCRVESNTMCYRLHAENTQGIVDYRRSLEIGIEEGFLSVATSNLVVVIHQVKSALNRLSEQSLLYPPQLDQFSEIFESTNILRPFRLLRLGISRGDPVKTASMLFSSIFVSSKQLENPYLYYR